MPGTGNATAAIRSPNLPVSTLIKSLQIHSKTVDAATAGATAVATDEQSSFVPATSASAPAALQQDPRAGDIAEEDQLTPADTVPTTDELGSEIEYPTAG